MAEKSEKNGKKTEYKRNEKGRFVKGTAPGPGRTLGQRDFKTDFEIAAREVAKALRLGGEPDPVYIELLKRGIREGLAGKFPFWEKLQDRIYGAIKQSHEIEGKMETDQIIEMSPELEKAIKVYEQAIKQVIKKGYYRGKPFGLGDGIRDKK